MRRCPALTGYEQGLILRTAFATHALKRAIVVVDFTGYNGAPDARHPLAGPLPSYLYDANPLNDAPYLLSWGVLVKSWRIVEGDTSEPFPQRRRRPVVVGGPEALRPQRGRCAASIRATSTGSSRRLPLDLAQMRTSFARNLLPVMAAHPETEFDVVWPPYSVVVWGDYVQRRQLDATLAFKRYVFAATRDLPNVRIVDLQPVAAVTHDLDNYTDLYHFSPAINEWLIAEACAGGHRVRDPRRRRLAGARDRAPRRGAFDPDAALPAPLSVQMAGSGQAPPRNPMAECLEGLQLLMRIIIICITMRLP